MHLLYITLGPQPAMHLQAAFSILSFTAHASNEALQITVLTDAPEWYKHLPNVHTEIILHTTQQHWNGQHNFFWRIKIKALEWAAAHTPGVPVLYADTDTFAYRPIQNIAQALKSGKAVMHLNEGALSTLKSKTERKMWQGVQAMKLSAVDEHTAMWNAGIAASPNNQNGKEYTLALRLCDAMLDAGVTPRLIEQFALSAALQQCYGLQPAQDSIAHYWSTKPEWNNFIAAFFGAAYLHNDNLQQLKEKFLALNLSSIPIAVQRKNTALRLHTLVDKMFPARNKMHL